MATFTVNFGNTTSPKHKVNKDFTNVKTVTGSVVYPSSVDNPRIKVKGGYINCNYATGLYGRKYWVVNQVLNEGFNYVELVSDAISSFPDSIIGTAQHVVRGATDFNKMIPDNYAVESKPQIKLLSSWSNAIGNTTEGSDVYLVGII